MWLWQSWIYVSRDFWYYPHIKFSSLFRVPVKQVGTKKSHMIYKLWTSYRISYYGCNYKTQSWKFIFFNERLLIRSEHLHFQVISLMEFDIKFYM